LDVLGIFSAFGLAASAGLNAYIPLLVVALLGRFTDLIRLGEPWSALTNWWIIGLLAVLAAIEFVDDKLPAVNHINDIVQTFVRPTAGAILFAATTQAITQIDPILSLAAGILVAGSVHGVKSLVVRPVVTATTAGAGNVPVSMLEDGVSTAVSVVSVVSPVAVGLVAMVFIAWLLWFFWRRAYRATL
jgi:hypothetical protein